jgi:hypothetical protein
MLEIFVGGVEGVENQERVEQVDQQHLEISNTPGGSMEWVAAWTVEVVNGRVETPVYKCQNSRQQFFDKLLSSDMLK